MKITKKKLIWLFRDLAQRLGSQPTKQQWNEDVKTPSDMPIRMSFGSWNNFVSACGYEPYKPYLSELAKRNRDLAIRGRRSPNYKGGRIKDKFGYIQIWMPEHPNAKLGGYVHEHRLIMSQHIGRPLNPNEYVHHKNGITIDDRIENFEKLKIGQHHSDHKKGKNNPMFGKVGNFRQRHCDWPDCPRPHYGNGFCESHNKKMKYRRKSR